VRSIRLLPVVIFAALALLVFKGIGLVTNGGYVLTGTTQVVAQDTGSSSSSADATMTLSMPSEATASDASPTMNDTAPTLTKFDGVMSRRRRTERHPKRCADEVSIR